MTKKHFIFFALWALQIQATAATVNASTAQTVALNFYKSTVSSLNPHTDLSAILVYTQNESDGTADFYVFDVNPVHGFVIISAADNVQPILAYSTETNFNSNFPEIGIKTWLSNTARSVRGAILSNVQPAAHNANLWNAYKQGLNPAQQKGTGVSPLLTTTWNQSPYYNAMCPYDNANQAQCITGCVATAMAQIMKYWAYPAKGSGSYSYADEESNGYSENIGTLSANFGATTYQWSSMPANVTSTNTPVATLMYQCGVALGMDYSAYGSMAYLYYYQHPCVYNAFKNYFGYDSLSLRFVSMSDDSAGWIGMLENELTAGRPILYSGSGPGGGHAWVCDGFDANELFHMNWGWSGQDDGYFAVTNLNPGGSDDLSEGQNIIIGIQPPAAPVANFGVNSVVSCNGICQFTDSSYGGPTSWLWNFGDGSTSTQQNPLHQYIKNGTYSVSLNISNVYGNSNKKISNCVTVSRPAAPSVNNASNCLASTFSLKANTSNPVTWFDSTGTQVSTANPFVTPALKETTTYWVEEWNIDTVNKTNYSVGEAPNTSGYYEYYYNNNNYFQLKFNVSLPITLQSVLIYSGVTGSRTIVCTNGSKTTLATKTVSVQPGTNRVNLNFSLPAGGPYYLGFTNDSLMEFGQDAASYPYTDASGIVQITGNNLKSNSYAYFYDWVVSEPGYCLSQLGPATATVGASAASITANGPTSFCEGGSVTLTATSGASYKWSSGQTTQTITATSAGTYAVTVVSTGSCSAVSGPEVVTVNAKPEAAITASEPTTFCSGASVTLTASSGKTYKWSSGQTTQAIAATTSGNYSVTVSNSSFCSAVSSPEAITVNAKPLATIAAGGPTAFCTGGSVILTASSNSTYKWSSGQTTQAITVAKSGNYTVSVVGSNSCSAISAGEVITVSAQPEATITATGATTFCANDSVVLTASPASTYAWSSGETTQAVTISTAGTYTVTVINSGTCSAISAPEVVVVNAAPEAAITSNGGICGDSTETLTAEQSDGATYNWSTGDTTFAISVKTAGNYAVTVSNADCSAEAASIVSACTDTTQGITGINSLSTNGYALQATAYPNPYTNQFHLKVESSSAADNIHIRIFNANGQLIEERISPADTTDVMLGSNNAAGVYFVQINQDNTNRELKVVKIE